MLNERQEQQNYSRKALRGKLAARGRAPVFPCSIVVLFASTAVIFSEDAPDYILVGMRTSSALRYHERAIANRGNALAPSSPFRGSFNRGHDEILLIHPT